MLPASLLLSGKASLFGSSSALHLPSFRFSNSTDTAAAVNTPAIPASIPPINAHLLPIFLLLSGSLVRLVIPIIFDGLKHSYNNWYPAKIIHFHSFHLAALDAPLFVKSKETE